MSDHLPENMRAALERACEEFAATFVSEMGQGQADFTMDELVIWQGYGQRIHLNGAEFDLVINNTYELKQAFTGEEEEAFA